MLFNYAVISQHHVLANLLCRLQVQYRFLVFLKVPVLRCALDKVTLIVLVVIITFTFFPSGLT